MYGLLLLLMRTGMQHYRVGCPGWKRRVQCCAQTLAGTDAPPTVLA